MARSVTRTLTPNTLVPTQKNRMLSYDTTRLLVAYTNESTTCRTPHFISDLLVALKEDDVSIKSVSTSNGYHEVHLVVNSFHVTVKGPDNAGTFAVCAGNKIVLASCARIARAPLSVSGAPIHALFVHTYSKGTRLKDLSEALKESSLTLDDVQWGNVAYLEAVPVVNAIHLLIPASSVS